MSKRETRVRRVTVAPMGQVCAICERQKWPSSPAFVAHGKLVCYACAGALSQAVRHESTAT